MIHGAQVLDAQETRKYMGNLHDAETATAREI